MRAEHTPGPWEARPLPTIGQEHKYWGVFINAPLSITAVTEANARLIAAAPELLTAAIIARDVLAAIGYESYTVASIESAIRKARGEVKKEAQ